MSLLRHATLAALLCSTAALAQSPSVDAATASDAPAAQSGFQMALRTGYGMPFGNSTGAPGDSYSSLVSGQVPLMLDIGGKLNEHFFLGAYLGLGFGGPGSSLESMCELSGVNCAHGSLRLGVQVQYNVAPAAKVNPWFGYGIGIESTAVAASGPSGDASVGVAGFELARLMGGVDFRLTHGVGIGPFADFTVGRYSTASTKEPSGFESSGDIEERAAHEWLTLGVRLVFFP